MPSELVAFCRSEGLALSGNDLDVRFSSGRHHRVVITEGMDHYQLSAVVVRRAILDSLEHPELWAWQRNRMSALVGFRVDDRGRLVAESWVPRAGLTKDEFHTYIWNLAAEADRVEHLLSGRDAE